MSEPFLGELRLVPYNFAPFGWAMADGQVLAIAQNSALFSLLGTTYGGNGTTNFNLPDLRGRVPIHQGEGIGLQNYLIGEAYGEESHTLQSVEMPQHNHLIAAAGAFGNTMSANGSVPAKGHKINRYATSPDGTTLMNEGMVTATGGSEPHNNLQPYLVLTWIIALEGVYPSRN